MKKPTDLRRQKTSQIAANAGQRFRAACLVIRKEENRKLKQTMDVIETAARELGAEFDIGAGEYEFDCACGALVCISATTGNVTQRRGYRCESLASIRDFMRERLIDQKERK